MGIHVCLSVCVLMSILSLVYASNMHTLTPSGIQTYTGQAVLVEGVWRTYATADNRGVLRRRLEDVKTCTPPAHRWAVGSSRGGGPRRDGSSSPLWLGVGVGNFLRVRARVLVRERLELVRCFAAPGQSRNTNRTSSPSGCSSSRNLFEQHLGSQAVISCTNQ